MGGPSVYAVLGATGNCGCALIQNLLRDPDAVVQVHAYCRNADKLTTKLPTETHDPRLHVFQGSLSNTDLLVDCLRGCRAVFLVVTMNDNMPGCHVAEDTARGVVSALTLLKPQQPTMPKLVVLSSATIDEHLSRGMSWFRPVMLRAASNVYRDLRAQEEFLRSQDWLCTVFVKPGGLAVDRARGYEIADGYNSFLSYLDLSAAMIEVADDVGGRWDGRNVGVLATGGGAAFPWGTPMCILCGLLTHYFPMLHRFLPKFGP